MPSDRFDPARHGVRVSTVQENLHNLREIVALLRKHVPAAVVVFTLSPVPLSATFRGVSCVTANAVSKAILRVAVDELLREQGLGLHQGHTTAAAAAVTPPATPATAVAALPDAPPDAQPVADAPPQQLFYWPAYEMVKEGFAQPYLDDGRHVRPDVVRQILELFGKYYVPHYEAPPAQADADAPGGHAEPAGGTAS